MTGKTLLEVRNLTATVAGVEILKGLDLTIRAGEVHAIMGPNGSGKSTFAKVLAGHPAYTVTGGEVLFEGKNLFELTPEERARAGLFLGFQYPIEIPGVTNAAFLRLAYNTVQGARGKDEMDPLEFDDYVQDKLKLLDMSPAFLERSVNEGFSGGEKKRNEILQMAILEPKFAILDEADSGLDIDALRIVANGVSQLRTPDNAVLLVTHYQRLLNYIVPDYVHVMDLGRIIKTGGKELALELESRGYDWVSEEHQAGGGGVMEAVKTSYLEQLLQGLPALPAGSRGWLSSLRSEALERANALAVPTTRDEDWRFTDLSPLYRMSFQRSDGPGSLPGLELHGWTLPEPGNRLVFLDGQFVAGLSDLRPESGVSVAPLAAAVAESNPVLLEHLGRYADFRAEPFTAVNTAWLQDGALIALARNQAAGKPVHLLFVSTRADVVSYPRVLVVAEAGSDCTLIEDFVSLHEGAYLTNAVAEIAVAAHARVRHVRLQREGKAAFHIGACSVRLERDSRYQSVAVALGARISRHNLTVTQAGEGAECQVDGLALIDGRQLADTHSFLDHTRPDGRSRQMHKCIVGGAAHAVFNGRIVVRPGAQRTASAQQSRNLLLTDKAHVDTKPQLEIFADDVKCAHGAAIGQLDPEHVFYLKSRGLSEATARDLLTFAFATEIVERIPVPSLVKRLEETVVRQTRGRQN